MTFHHPDAGAGYELREAPGFAARVEKIFGDLDRWDEIRIGLDLWMLRRPTELPLSHRVDNDRWFVKIHSSPVVLLVYSVDAESRIVTYLDIKIIHDPLSALDAEFDRLS